MSLPAAATFPGLDRAWSTTVVAPDAEGVPRRWHLLERAADSDSPVGTMLCVHGNPTWSYLWRRVLAEAPPGWRVIAVDQLGMGYSEHPRGDADHPRTLAQRLDDLDSLTDALALTGPVVAVGHDWGGIVVSGWAQRHQDLLAGLILANTAVHHDFEDGLPRPLRLARHRLAWKAATIDTPAFVRGATEVSSPKPPSEVRAAYAAPYSSAAERSFVGQFVADIPLEPDHPTRRTFEDVAAGLAELRVPALLLRGPKDPVFSEEHLRDLRRRLPHADVHRYEGASHLVLEDAPRTATDLWNWVAERVMPAQPKDSWAQAGRPAPPAKAVGTEAAPWQGLLDVAAARPDELCVTEMSTGRRVTFAEIEDDIDRLAAGFVSLGMQPGDRVALLVPPGIDLTVAVYAAWRVGAVIVVADAGLGVAGMGRALRGAGPAFIVGITKGLAACAAMRVPGRRIASGEVAPAARRALKIEATMDELRQRPAGPLDSGEAGSDRDCAVLFTSGATGPSKGVVYRVNALRAMIGHFGGIYDLVPGERLVAAFAPFALYGPALGIGAVVPDMDPTKPGTLTAAALADAISAAQATKVFASPAALRNVVKTAGDLTPGQREAMAGVQAVMSAGAPVPVSLLRAVCEVMPNAVGHTPYGMTEVLPVSDITLDELDEAGACNGVCVGRPLPDTEIRISPLPADPTEPDGALTTQPGVTGEIIVRAAHVKDRYDQLWATERASSLGPGVHRSGDVGHLDEQGRLWVEGRRVHVIYTATGPVTPVALEQAALQLAGVDSATVVGVGPIGTQQVVVVLVLEPEFAGTARRLPGLARLATTLAPPSLAAQVRTVAAPLGIDVAAVLLSDRVPVDIRHQSKIDRTAVAAWASKVLAGERAGSL